MSRVALRMVYKATHAPAALAHIVIHLVRFRVENRLVTQRLRDVLSDCKRLVMRPQVRQRSLHIDLCESLSAVEPSGRSRASRNNYAT